MSSISKWEVSGVSVAAVLESLYALGVFEAFGITPEMLPHLLLVMFFFAALVRGAMDRKKAS